MPRLIPADQDPIDQQVVAQAAEALERGELVALPTETVYGLCARANRPEALERIYEVKGRPEDKALPFFVPDAEAAWTFANRIPPRALALLETFWPGPLTLVVGEGRGVALRCPDEPFTRAVLAAVEGPVAATSANRSGEPPATTAGEAMEGLAHEEALLVFDGGPARGGAASTVARVEDHGQLTIFREGGLERATLEKAAPWRVTFVCTGNTCRSPMAETVFREELQSRLGNAAFAGHEVEIASAGLAAYPGDPMNPEAVAALEDAGRQPVDHAARPIDESLAARTDLWLALTASHADALDGRVPGQVQTLDPTGDVPDPIGRGPEVYRATLERLEAVIRKRLDDWFPSNETA